ncbi:T9SS type A sorting domain-containing protein [Aquimarina brevivitae]|uniref:Putative secreted protein (Por secretion system target) n=1 Tax=Aquimarina brevivitae TaxID=323412 RepID=A0A4V2F5D6_9FLAO|nr:T9SS type A sorting domain-containing protein [Aquimarina brevivitae]RZS92449.1 putative secreted protein (Por secretion system target) [Aquimarina brevivitae]
MNNYTPAKHQLVYIFLLICFFAKATDYHVGPSETLITIAEVPWATLQPGDRVYIHWRATPYKEKWVINRQGTETNPIEIIGVSNAQGEQPIIDGADAVTPTNLSYWGDQRGVIKIGGSSVPQDGLPSHIIIDNLDIRSARPAYSFIDENEQSQTYTNNAAAIYVEKASNLTIRNCTLSDSGNGLFIGAFDGQTANILIEGNYIYDNGIVGRIFEHNAYTAALGITYQFNRFGPLRDGALGNNLKDRSAGLVVRYNWIESGNRQLDLVDAEDSQVLVNDPSYNTTYVYGNILIEPDGAGNSQMVHYGGDSGTTADYRKGNLYFYNNTLISTRSGNTTLIRLSTNDETANIFNNIVYNTASGSNLAMIDGSGTANIQHNWFKSGYTDCHCTPSGAVTDLGGNITGENPGFEDLNTQSYNLLANSAVIDQGMAVPGNLLPDYAVESIYSKHQSSLPRVVNNALDMGAFEFDENLSVIDVELNEQIIAYPNPIRNKLNILGITDRLTSPIVLYDNLGRKIKTVALSQNTIDLSDFSSGVYYLNLGSSKSTIKLIKE